MAISPIILVGTIEKVGIKAIEALLPEVEVLHYTLQEASFTEVPALLQGKQLGSDRSSSIGTNDYSKTIEAVCFSPAATHEIVIGTIKAVEAAGIKNVTWVEFDQSRPASTTYDQAYVDDVCGRYKKATTEAGPGKKGEGRTVKY